MSGAVVAWLPEHANAALGCVEDALFACREKACRKCLVLIRVKAKLEPHVRNFVNVGWRMTWAQYDAMHDALVEWGKDFSVEASQEAADILQAAHMDADTKFSKKERVARTDAVLRRIVEARTAKRAEREALRAIAKVMA